MCQPGSCEHRHEPFPTPHEAGGGTPGPGRRALLMAGGIAGAAGVLTLAPVTFAGAAESGTPEGGEVTKVITGRLGTGVPDFVYLPVEVPRGVNQISVSYTYDKPPVPAGTQGSSCDIGVFDEHGTALGGRGFRGWSGGARTAFVVNSDSTTPGYLPGPVNHGTWHIVLGPYQTAPQGMEYSVGVTLRYGAPGAPFVPSYPAERAKGRGRAWYRGDAHLHTVHSDGSSTSTPAGSGRRARA
ncbi:hypothetical protein ACIF70_32305 [Actinacidiphila glaucinigra]|uniref:hypothetical protein n=1 Tax=Actinacidiphila glaucinigra TaxID=235986 RepID=UPI0037CAE1EE